MITFDNINVALPSFDQKRVTEWIKMVAVSHQREVGNINYLFCDDAYILDANRKFVNHDYFTDIITFDYSNSKRIAGDILISMDTVESNATKYGVSVDSELMRVVIHGVLHLCGIDDKGPGERDIMEKNENDALNMLSSC